MFSTGLRDLASTPELRALLGAADRDLYRPLMALAAGAALVTTVMTASLTAWSLPASALVLSGVCVATYRLRTRPRPTYDGLILETGFGQVPLDLIRQWLRGPDVLLVTALLVVLVV